MQGKETAARGQRLNQQHMPRPALSLNDEGKKLSEVDMWEDNDGTDTDRYIQNDRGHCRSVVASSI